MCMLNISVHSLYLPVEFAERQLSANHWFVIAVICDMSFTCDKLVVYMLHFVFCDKMKCKIQQLFNAINKDFFCRKHYVVTGKGDDVTCVVVTNCRTGKADLINRGV
jgi:hypothetical protein